jgi:hypothetical protein
MFNINMIFHTQEYGGLPEPGMTGSSPESDAGHILI